MALLLLYISVALGASFLCSLLEAVLLSVNASYIASEIAAGRRNGQWWKQCKEDIDKPLASILSLNTIAHTSALPVPGLRRPSCLANSTSVLSRRC